MNFFQSFPHRLRAVFIALMMVGLSISFYGCDDTKGDPNKNIIEVLQEEGDFDTLLSLLETAGLTTTLEGPGIFTVFAPTDEAFELLSDAEMEALLEDIPLLTQVLTYHVVTGAFDAEEILAAGTLITVEGQEVVISTSEGDLFVNEALIIEEDIIANNGIIHAIDMVLMPPLLGP